MDFRQTEVTLDGKKYHVYFNLIALMKYAKQAGKKLDSLLASFSEELDVLGLIPLFHLGLLYGAKKAGKDFNLTESDVEDLIALDPQGLAAMTNALMESMPKAEDIIQEDGKKLKPVKKKKAG